jgi:ABC-2 type transport system permease protein
MQNPIPFVYHLMLTNFRLSLALKGAFYFTVIITIIKQILFLTAWRFFFAKYQVVQGWNFDNMLLMYGTVCFSIGFIEAFFYGLKDLPRMIETGQLDTFLLQPKNVVLNVAMSKGDMASFGEIVTGIIVIAYSGYLEQYPFMVLSILALGTLFVFSLFLYLSCIAFFLKDSYDLIRELNLNAIIVASQPNVAYRGLLKMLTFTILPVVFLSFFPIEFLRTGLWKYLFFSAIGTIGFFLVAYGLFHLGLKRYESGNILAFRH